MNDVFSVGKSIIGYADNIKAQRENEIKTGNRLKTELEEAELFSQKLELARIALTEFSRVTQEEIKAVIEELVTLALRSVFDRDWQFKLYFERKNNAFQIRPVIIEDNEEFDPKDELGGGAIDVISYTLRIILFTLAIENNPDIEKTMWLDEPMKFVGTGDLMNRAGNMIREISKSLGIQTIIITHDEEIAEIADRAWEIVRDGKISKATQTVGVVNTTNKKTKRERIRM